MEQGLMVRGDGPLSSIISSSDPAGAFHFTLPASTPWFNFLLEVRSIGVTARGSLSGAAFEVVTQQASADDIVPKVTVHMNDVTVQGAAGADHFGYGIKAVHLVRPIFDAFKMSGQGSVACFWIEDTYGIGIKHSSCAGAQFGLNAVRTSEGNIISDSEFLDVGTAIKMEVVPGEVPGPSAMDGKILNTRIRARTRGIDLDGKTFFTIQGNMFESSAGNGVYTDVMLTDTQRVFVTENIFVGTGVNRTGISVVRGTKPWPKSATVTSIARNTFGSFQTGVSVSAGAKGTYILNNTFNTVVQVKNNGASTYIYPSSSAPNNLPIGNFDFANLSTANKPYLTGWTFDPDASSTSLTVEIYKGGTYLTGTKVATLLASGLTPVVNTQYGIIGNHRFKYELPANQPLTGEYRAYALDANTNARKELDNSPKIITVGTSCVLDGVTIPHGFRRAFYSVPSVTAPATCVQSQQFRTCTSGVLSGSATYRYAMCTGGVTSSTDI
jgi:hypothetical protein